MSLKSNLKNAIGIVCESPCFRPYLKRAANGLVNVIYYHHVGIPDPHYQAFYSGCTLSRFQDDLERLGRVYDFVSLDEVVDATIDPLGRKRPTLALTFDDGFDLRKSGVMKVLAGRGIKATTFLITSCIGNEKLMWRHALSAIQTLVTAERWRTEYVRLVQDVGFPPLNDRASLISASNHWAMRQKDDWVAWLWKRCGLPAIEDYLQDKTPYFDLEGLQAWLSAGHSIGFHTHTHPFCSKLTPADLASEIIEPAAKLRQVFGLSHPPYLSYPFGDRLQPGLEQELFRQGSFKAFFGIGGFKHRGASNATLERAGTERNRVGWTVFASTVLGKGPLGSN